MIASGQRYVASTWFRRGGKVSGFTVMSERYLSSPRHATVVVHLPFRWGERPSSVLLRALARTSSREDHSPQAELLVFQKGCGRFLQDWLAQACRLYHVSLRT